MIALSNPWALPYSIAAFQAANPRLDPVATARGSDTSYDYVHCY